MVVMNSLKNNMAAALAQETYVVPAWMAVGTSPDIISSGDIEIGGEVGDRLELSSPDRTNNEVVYNALRLGGDVVNTNGGDTLRQLGTLTQETGGVLMTNINLPNLIQTTNFDIDATIKIRFE